jgi:hypothetical protein
MTLEANDGSVISAFLDGEPFDPAELGRALSAPAGRQMLIDFVSLRQLVVDEGPQTSSARAYRRSAWTGWLVAAALALAIGGAWLMTPKGSTPPKPDRVITLERGVDWQEK